MATVGHPFSPRIKCGRRSFRFLWVAHNDRRPRSLLNKGAEPKESLNHQ